MPLFYTTDPIGFYDDEISPPPNNAKPISYNDWASLITGQSQGKTIIANGDNLVLSDPPPPPVDSNLITKITPLEFFSRFTSDEETALATAAMKNVQLFLWFTKTSAAAYVDLTSDSTKQGLAALKDAKLLSQTRIDEILMLKSTDSV